MCGLCSVPTWKEEVEPETAGSCVSVGTAAVLQLSQLRLGQGWVTLV